MHNIASFTSFVSYVYFMPVLRQFSDLQQREIVTLSEVKYCSVMGVHSWKTKLKIWRISLKIIVI